MSYNVENLFYPENDSLHQDDEFTPEGARHWSYTRYRNKLAHIAQVMASIGDWQMPTIVGLQEIEEDRCLEDLCRYYLPSHKYRFVHFDGPDERGIDVALIYDTTQVTLRSARAIPVKMSEGMRPSRDVLYTEFLTEDSMPLHVFTCHLPSQLGGAGQSAFRREAVYRVLRLQTDSLLQADSLAQIVVMGDFNSNPLDCLSPLINLMIPMADAGLGTEKYHGRWSCLDQFFVSPSLAPRVDACILEHEFLLEPDSKYLGMRPLRTFYGYKYKKNGFSDHLPILLEWKQAK